MKLISIWLGSRSRKVIGPDGHRRMARPMSDMSKEKGTDGLPHVFELRVRRLVFFAERLEMN